MQFDVSLRPIRLPFASLRSETPLKVTLQKCRERVAQTVFHLVRNARTTFRN